MQEELTAQRGEHGAVRAGQLASRPRQDFPARAHAWLAAVRGWLELGESAILIAVAAVLLLTGILVLLDGARDLLQAVLQPSGNFALSVANVAENALLAMIVAELVGTLLLALGGHALRPEPFLVIGIVAVVRDLLISAAKNGDDRGHAAALLVLGVLAFVLTGALALARQREARHRHEGP